MYCAVIGQRGHFAMPLSIPYKLAHCQSAHVGSDFDMLDTRFRRHLFFATPAVYDNYFATVSNRDVHKRIVIQTAKLDGARRFGEWLLHHRIPESLRAVIKYQQEVATAAGDADREIPTPAGSSELSRC